MAIVIDLDKVVKDKLGKDEILCPVFSRVESVSGGFQSEKQGVSLQIVPCIGKLCGWFHRCRNIPQDKMDDFFERKPATEQTSEMKP